MSTWSKVECLIVTKFKVFFKLSGFVDQEQAVNHSVKQAVYFPWNHNFGNKGLKKNLVVLLPMLGHSWRLFTSSKRESLVLPPNLLRIIPMPHYLPRISIFIGSRIKHIKLINLYLHKILGRYICCSDRNYVQSKGI